MPKLCRKPRSERRRYSRPPDFRQWKCIITKTKKDGPLFDHSLCQSVLNDATDAGIGLSFDGDDLVLEGPVPPSRALLSRLKHYKPSILNLLQWWHERFEERAAYAGYNSYGVSRHEAEVDSFDTCVDIWLDKNRVTSPNNFCVQCGVGDQSNDALRSYTGADVLHAACYPAWFRSREAEAMAFLAAIGIRPPWHDSAEGWRKYFEERAGNNGRNCDPSRAEAEAYNHCLNTRLDLNVPCSPDDVCLHCGAGEQPNDALRPHLNIVGGAQAWLLRFAPRLMGPILLGRLSSVAAEPCSC
jgi:hypothetical protein